MAQVTGGRAATGAQWQAFAARAPVPGVVFAVATTGIHCRAGCPARRPLPENLRVFDSVQVAEAAGFRACKRCGGGA